ncbi:MAG TPA: DRTGG domain-containing protein [Anaerolineae bacterium]|nr:DRTGG domain-containing protein [Anaerolineae bacterium]
MIVQDLVAELGLQVHSPGNVEREVTGGYASDLLSCAMAGAKAGNVWVTLQAHPNVVAVASLLDLAAVIVSEGVAPDLETIERAQENGVTVLSSPATTYDVVARLAALGIPPGV